MEVKMDDETAARFMALMQQQMTINPMLIEPGVNHGAVHGQNIGADLVNIAQDLGHLAVDVAHLHQDINVPNCFVFLGEVARSVGHFIYGLFHHNEE